MSDFGVVEGGLDVVNIEEVEVGLDVVDDLNELDEVFEDMSREEIEEIEELGEEVEKVDGAIEEEIAAEAAGTVIERAE